MVDDLVVVCRAMEILFPHHSTIITSKEIPGITAGLLPYADVVISEGGFGRMLRQESSQTDFSIHLQKFDMQQPVELALISEAPAHLIYLLDGKACFGDVALSADDYGLLYRTAASCPVYLSAGQHTIVQIELSSSMCHDIREGTSRISHRISEMLMRMLYCRFGETERRLYQQARVLDLLLCYSEDSCGPSVGRYQFSASDIRAVLDAEALQKENAG